MAECSTCLISISRYLTENLTEWRSESPSCCRKSVAEVLYIPLALFSLAETATRLALTILTALYWLPATIYYNSAYDGQGRNELVKDSCFFRFHMMFLSATYIGTLESFGNTNACLNAIFAKNFCQSEFTYGDLRCCC